MRPLPSSHSSSRKRQEVTDEAGLGKRGGRRAVGRESGNNIKEPGNNFRCLSGGLQRNDLSRYNLLGSWPNPPIQPPSATAPSPPRHFPVLPYPPRGAMMSDPVFHGQKRAMTRTIWPVSSLQSRTWCYDYTLQCRSYMPGIGGGKPFKITFIEYSSILLSPHKKENTDRFPEVSWG